MSVRRQAANASDFAACRLGKMLFEGAKNRTLVIQNLRLRLGEAEPAGAIRLGKLRDSSGFRRPFHREGIAGEVFQVKIAFQRENAENFCAWFEIAERNEFSRRHAARLL